MLFGEFVRKGIPECKLCATGIPIKGAFYDQLEQKEARRRLGLKEEGRFVLLGCGSMGCGRLERHAIELANRLPGDVSLVVLCGKNEELANNLSRFSSDMFCVVGFTKDIPLYMSAADIYLTKPGGLTTTEAIVKRLPMVLVEAVPGCETRNLNFLSEMGVGERAGNWTQAISKTVSMVGNDGLAKKQKERMEHFHAGVSARQICQYIQRRI
jgi:processive 1,2-diacylglycerol beta-glucosyltransferase